MADSTRVALTDPIKVGVIADQTGPLSFIGLANANVARMVIDELNAEGATIVVITHDDRYFHLGNRVIELDEGRLATSPRPAAHIGRA